MILTIDIVVGEEWWYWIINNSTKQMVISIR